MPPRALALITAPDHARVREQCRTGADGMEIFLPALFTGRETAGQALQEGNIGNIYEAACALSVGGAHAKAVRLHRLVPRSAGQRQVCGRPEWVLVW